MTDKDKQDFIQAMRSEAFKSYNKLKQIIAAPSSKRPALEQEYIQAGVDIGTKIIRVVQSPAFKTDQKFQAAMQSAMSSMEVDLGMNPVEKVLSGELSIKVTSILSRS